jgi:hypothetical protein
MSSDPNKKSARTFQCRDVLSETFEQMARELECSVDYLINEAMKQYARQRSYGGAGASGGGTARSQPYSGGRESQGGFPSAPPPSMGPPQRNLAPPPPPARSSGGLPPPPARGNSLPAPPPPMRTGGGFAPPPRTGGMTAAPMGRPPTTQSVSRSAPPPVPPDRASMRPPTMNGGYAQAQTGTLSCFYQGDKVAVTKDRFVIGRGKQSSDLTLKDPNVSRQHAMIEYQNGVYFMVDMGSTNGVEYNGQRIARKQIAEGDVFRICDHDLRFTYR